MHANPDLPAPSPEALEVSHRLVERLRRRIESGGGWIDFSDYMKAVLYEPGLGYYSAGAQKFGAAGDFVTAPEISPLFARCIARAIAPVFERLAGSCVLELGAGTGALAAELLVALQRLGCLPDEYRVLEPSADLRERQRETLQTQVPELAARVRWLDRLPDAGFRGVILANEVLDALPVSRFRLTQGRAEALGVGLRGDRFASEPRRVTSQTARLLDERLPAGLPDHFVSEYCPSLPAWVGQLAGLLERGLVLFADYGLPRREYYHPARASGTLVCHYRHRVHHDPFLWPGCQDISAWVDFTAVAQAGIDAGLDLAGYTTQAHFLIANGIETEAAALAGESDADQIAQASALRQLLLPGEMGEHFKLIAMSRALPPGIVNIGHDLSHRL
ncbi:MAG TPA: hypothetical protein ENK16_08620 [Chromatiales bacterium]|nr:hypothetical protein [Chromatiales bacterium]